MPVNNVVMKLPSSVRVGPYDIRILIADTLQMTASARWGEFSSIEQAIRVDVGIATNAKAVDTVIHELLHAIWWAYQIRDDDKEERTVSMIALGWLALLRDNPDLLQWLNVAIAQISGASPVPSVEHTVSSSNGWRTPS